MSNNIDPSQIVHYISFEKHLCVNRNNGTNQQLVKFDYNLTDTFNFSVINKINTILDLSGYDYELFVSFIDNKQQLHVLAYNNTPTFSADNKTMTFVVDTYTNQFLNNIKTQKKCDLTIVAKNKTTDKTSIVLRDVCICYPRPYIPNQAPIEIVNHNILVTLNNTVSGSFFAGSNIPQTLGVDSFAFGQGLRTSSANQFVAGSYNTVDGEKVFIIGNGTSDSERSNAFSVDYQGNVEANAISATSLTVNGSSVATAADLTGFATEEWVEEQGYLTAHQSLDGYATEQWVQSQGYLTAVNLDGYALQSDLALSTANLGYQISQLALDIPTKTSDLTNDSGFITGYTAGSGISISNTNVISIDGELGKTYYADDTTLQLNEANNTFSVKSIRTKLNNGPGISLTEDGNGVVTITNTGGSGGGGGYVYTNGTGLGLSTVTENEEYQFYVDQAWLTGYIESATSGLQNYTAGTGISIVGNVISVSGDYASQTDLTAVSAVVSAILEAEVVTPQEAEQMISAATSALASEEFVTSSINTATTDMATTGWVESQHYITSAEAPSTVYFAGTGLKLEDSTFSLTATVSDIEGYNTLALKTDLTDLATAEQVSSLSSAIDDNTSGITELNSAMNEKADKDAFQTLSTTVDNIVASGLITTTEVDEQIATASAAIISSVPSTEYQAGDGLELQNGNTFVLTAQIPSVEGLASETYVQQQVSGKADTNTLQTVSGLLTTDIATKANSADVYSKTEIDNKGFITQIPTTYVQNTTLESVSAAITAQIPTSNSGLTNDAHYITSSEIPAEYVTETELATTLEPYAQTSWVESNFLSSTTSTAIINTASGAATDWVNAQGYLTEHQDISNLATKEEVSTASSVLTTAINDLTTGQIATLTGKVDTLENAGYQTASDVNTTVGNAINDLSTTYYNKTETTGLLSSVSATVMTAIPTAVADFDDASNYVTNTELTEATSSFITSADIPTEKTKLSQFNNDVGFITTADIPDTSDFVTSSDVNEQITGTVTSTYVSGLGFITAEDIPEGTVYLAGDGLKLQNATFSLTGTILTGGTNIEVSGKSINYTGPTTIAQFSDASNYTLNTDFERVSGVVSTISGDYVKNAQITSFIDATSAESIATNAISAASGTIVTTASSAIDSNYIEGLGFKKTDTTYTAGTGLKLDGTEFSLTASIPTVSTYVGGNLISVTSTGTNEYTIAFTGTIPTVPTNVSDFTNDVGYITGITVSYNDDEWNEYTLSGKGISFTDDIYFEANESNDIVNVVWKGVKFAGGTESIDQFAKRIDWSSDFTVQDDEGDVIISLATPIPLSTSQLTNNSDYQTGTQVSAIASAVTTGVVDVNYVSGLGFIQLADIPTVTISTYVAGDNISITPSTSNQFVVSATDTTYTAGNGLKLEGTEFSLTASIPTGLASWEAATNSGYIRNQGFALTSELTGDTTYSAGTGLELNDTTFSVSASWLTGQITSVVDATYVGNLGFATTTALADKVNNTDFATVCGVLSTAITGVTNDVTALKAVSGDFANTSSSFALANNVYDKTSADAKFATKEEIKTYKAGEGLALSSDNETFYLTAQIPDDAHISAIASGYAGGGSVDVDTICGMLSSANENLTITKSSDKILFTATGGGGTGNIVGGAGIRVIQDGGNTVISIATATLIATSAAYTFDFRNTSGEIDYNYDSYNGNQNLIMSYTGTLPAGVTATGITSGYQFEYVSGANVSNTTSTITAYFDAYDITQPTSAEVQIKTIGFVNAAISATPVTSYMFDANNAETISAFTWDISSGTPQNLTVEISGTLPDGITSALSLQNETLTLSCTSESLTQNGTKTVNVIFDADNIERQIIAIQLTVQNAVIRTPLTFTGKDTTNAIQLTKIGNPNAISLQYSKNGGQWTTYTIDEIIEFGNDETVAFKGNNSAFNVGYNNQYQFVMTGIIDATGNIQSLMGYSDTVVDNCYYRLFRQCNSMRTAPQLPAMNLANSCYRFMFNECLNLITAPQLPATTLVQQCYDNMFFGCSNLTGCPNIAGTNLVNQCCQSMFQSCPKFSYVRVNFANTTLNINSSTNLWFNGASSTGTFVCPTSLTIGSRSDSTVPTGWTITTF